MMNDERLQERKQRDLIERSNAEVTQLFERGPITVEIEAHDAMVLIAQLQLASRHPQNSGPSRERAQAFIDLLTGAISEPGSALEEMIRAGDDPEFDLHDEIAIAEHRERRRLQADAARRAVN